MSLSVGKMVRNLASDGYFGKKDLQQATENMLDGRGITKTEKKRWKNEIDKVFADPSIRTTHEAECAYEDLNTRLRGYSRTKEVFAPTLDKDEIKNILDNYTSSGRSSGGGESGFAVRAWSGGE